MSKEPELGQIVFGNPTGEYGTRPFVDALVEGILDEIDRVYWNVNQKQWNRDDLKMQGFEFRSYDWSENPETTSLPNLKFDFSEQEIRWYKHPGRGQSSSLQWSEKEWAEWYEKALEVVGANDKELY